MFTDEFLDSLPEDPHEALEAMCNEYESWVVQNVPNRKFLGQHHNDLLEAYAAAEALIQAHGLPYKLCQLVVGESSNITNIQGFFTTIAVQFKNRKKVGHIEATRMKYRRRFGAGFMYEFSDGDLKRIQDLINELRDAITASELFEEKHKQRILKKLEKLQAEMHKKMGSIAQIYELVGDFGVLLGKFGEDAKPFVDRIREIVQIGWRAEARAEELPSGLQFPQLPDGKGKEDIE